jgi:hypothetical protein
MYTEPMESKENKAAEFIKYNNAVPIILGALFFATSATFAASPAVRESVYDTETVVQSVDTTYIYSVDLEDYPFLMRITNVTEDERFYYLAYDFDTIDIVEGVWQDVVRQSTLRIAKGLLGNGSLEDYAESELAQVRAAEILRLTKTQEEQRKIGATQKTVATVHSGLVGDFFAPTEETVPQYESKIAKDDPLRVKNPQPSETFDGNVKPKAPPKQGEPQTDWCPDIEGVQTTREACATENSGETTDQCPDMEGVQSDVAECPVIEDGGEEAPPEEPPVEQPPVEEPPLEEVPAEVPVEEPPPTENPSPEG